MQTLPSREQGEHKATNCLLEAGKHGSRNWIEEQAACSPRWGMKDGVKVHAWLRRATLVSIAGFAQALIGLGASRSSSSQTAHLLLNDKMERIQQCLVIAL